jgi:hypothetical protein
MEGLFQNSEYSEPWLLVEHLSLKTSERQWIILTGMEMGI